MASQLDLDQGGTNRTWEKVYLGPSVGWVAMPARSQLNILSAGTFTVDLSTSYVAVNANGLVIIILPTSSIPAVPAGVIPGPSVRNPISIVDVGGFASAGNPITIQPAAGETIMGLVQVQITSAFGGFILYRNGAKWTNQS